MPEGPPLHFRWRRALHRVARAEGPERIAPEWWREGCDGPDARLFPRRGCRRPPLLALPARSLRSSGSRVRAGIMHGSFSMNAYRPAAYAEFGCPIEFFVPARRIETGGTGRGGEAPRAFRRLGLPTATRSPARCAPGSRQRWKDAIRSYHPGCRLVFCDGTPDILAYPQDRKGWGHLCRMLTQANMREETEKGAPLSTATIFWNGAICLSLAVLPDLKPTADDRR